MPVPCRPLGHPSLVGPIVGIEVANLGSCAGGRFAGERIRVGLLSRIGLSLGDDAVLVQRTIANPSNESLPYAGTAAPSHGVATAVPIVEVADHRDRIGVGRPDREPRPDVLASVRRVRTQALKAAVVIAASQPVKVPLGQESRLRTLLHR